MEINKEEAIRCLRIAKNHYGTKNFEAALRLTKKSLKLYPTDEAKEFLAKAEMAAASAEPNDIRQEEAKPARSATSDSSSKPSSSAQSQEVREILACGTDYYKVLKVDKKCTEVEVKKAYRKVNFFRSVKLLYSKQFHSLLLNSILIKTRLLELMKHLNVNIKKYCILSLFPKHSL